MWHTLATQGVAVVLHASLELVDLGRVRGRVRVALGLGSELGLALGLGLGLGLGLRVERADLLPALRLECG